MRDYFLEPAQTNLELYAQFIARGSDGPRRRRLADAYHLALQQVFPMARGSGKPFIAHLVGTASLVLASGGPDDWVIAALMHALYQRRVRFSGGLSPEKRRPVIAALFGPDVDDLIHRYTAFEDRDLAGIPAQVLTSDADVVTLRLADELEDLSGNALALHGASESGQPKVRGSYAWRRDAKTNQSDTLLETARVLGLPGIARGLAHWLDFSAVPHEMSDFRTGWLSSVDLPGLDGASR